MPSAAVQAVSVLRIREPIEHTMKPTSRNSLRSFAVQPRSLPIASASGRFLLMPSSGASIRGAVRIHRIEQDAHRFSSGGSCSTGCRCVNRRQGLKRGGNRIVQLETWDGTRARLHRPVNKSRARGAPVNERGLAIGLLAELGTDKPHRGDAEARGRREKCA